jgi:hypothetical protein
MATKTKRTYQSGHEVFSEFVPNYVKPRIERSEDEGLISASHRKHFVDDLLREFDEALKSIPSIKKTGK